MSVDCDICKDTNVQDQDFLHCNTCSQDICNSCMYELYKNEGEEEEYDEEYDEEEATSEAIYEVNFVQVFKIFLQIVAMGGCCVWLLHKLFS